MTDMKETLDALDKAATPGVWSVCIYDCGDTPYYDSNGPCPSIQSESEDCAIIHWDGFKQEYWTSANGNQKQIRANAELIVTLANAYRAGHLIVKPDRETLREKVARALRKVPLWDGSPIVSDAQLTDDEVNALADAALTTIFGEPT